MKNPSAFPHSHLRSEPGAFRSIDDQQDGMTLRDYFAAGAMQSLTPASVTALGKNSAEHISVLAYGIADAMLVEREKQNGKA